jgi:hypothetical protein
VCSACAGSHARVSGGEMKAKYLSIEPFIGYLLRRYVADASR